MVVYDNLSAGHREAVRWGELVVGDAHDLALLRETIRRHRISAVMHFAAWLAVGESVRDPLGYYRNNVAGALTVLEAMAAESVTRFVFSSTAAVYGEPDTTPVGEDHPLKPINPYGETKLTVERALPYIERAHGVHAVCLRYFNAAGADPDGEIGEDHDPETHLIPRAVDAALGGPSIEVFGTDYPTPDGTCLRDYVHVSDLADAHVLALDGLERDARSAVYNVGIGRPFSVRDVLVEVGRLSGREVPQVVAPRREGDPAVLFASSDRIRAELGWRPRHTELAGIVETAWNWRTSRSGAARRGAER